jgi:hypothetical protein
MSVVTVALRALLRRLPPLKRVDDFVRHPVKTQADLLRDLLRRAASTEWGRRYDFADLARRPDVIAAYRERVPLHTWADLKDDATRIRRGAEDVTWPGRIKNFAVSSGTASEGKVVPVTREMVDNDRAFSIGTGLNYLAQTGNLRFLFGKHLTLPGRIEDDPENPEATVGEISGLLAERAPGYFRRIFQAIPNEVAFLPNWEAKLRAIAERTVGQDIRLVVMAPTWALVLFETLMQVYNERHGAGAATTVSDVWPNLQVFISGGVALASYRDLLEEQIGKTIDFIETYGASEGFFAFQRTLGDPSMLLHLDNGVFYEFVPMDAYGQEGAPRLSVAEVQPGVRYALYVSTCSGLWAYDVGDVVRFTSVQPHQIVVAGRTGEMIDKYGEAVFGDEARAALAAACEATGARVADYHIAPREARKGRLPTHEWLVEFEAAPHDATAFAEALDDHLQHVNRHYQIRREAQAFAAPAVTALPGGTFYAWLKATKDRISGQTKVPRMSETRAVADAVLQHADALGGARLTPPPPASGASAADDEPTA